MQNRSSYTLIPVLILFAVLASVVWAVDAKVVSRIQITNYLTTDDETVNLSFTESQTTNYTSGTGSGAINEAWIDSRTLAASTSEDLDLAGGLVRGGYTYTFTKIKVLRIEAASANSEDIEVGGASANQLVGPFGAVNDTVGVPPGGFITFCHITTGWDVTAGTGDLLKILAGASGGTYRVTVVGEATKS